MHKGKKGNNEKKRKEDSQTNMSSNGPHSLTHLAHSLCTYTIRYFLLLLECLCLKNPTVLILSNLLIIFALFLNQIGDYMGDFGSDELVFKIVATLKKILQLQLEAGGSKEASLLNLAVVFIEFSVIIHYIGN